MSPRLLGVALLGACSLPDPTFRASPDGAAGDDDGRVDPLQHVLAIEVSTPAVDLDEGATVDFTVWLSQAPGAPLEVDLASAAPDLGLSTQKLFFDASNFGLPQTVTISAATDDDTETEVDEITLAGAGVETVKVGATIHDTDKLTLVVDQTDAMTVTEGTSTEVHVHLASRPPGDVEVTAMLAGGPITIDPPAHVFHSDDYASDVTFTLSAAIDADAADQSQLLTFGIAGGDQRLITVLADDRDTLAISASPTSITHLREGDSVTLNITLTRQPTAPVTVKVETTTGKVQLGSGAVTFLTTGNDYMVAHPVTITAPIDTNTSPETDAIKLSVVAGAADVTPVSISVQIDDRDTQAIQTTVTNSLTVVERASAPFGVTLKFAPTGTFTVNLASADPSIVTVASSTGANFLTFTAANYNDPAAHQVVVSGANDNNLITNSTSITLTSGTLQTSVAVDVTDADQQAFVLTPATPLSIPEGGKGQFTLALKFQPTAAVHIVLSSTSAALPVFPAAVDFSTTNWQTAVPIEVRTMVDSNNVGETGTISVTSAPIPSASLAATMIDATQINSYGWPDQLATTYSILQGQIFAFPVTVPTSSLDSFGVLVPTAAGEFRMALYQNVSGRPGLKVAGAEFGPRPLSNGTTITDISDVQIPAGTYWIAIRVGATTGIGAGDASQIGMQCLRNTDIVNLITDWPADFGPSSCNPAGALFNLWITTYHQ